MSNLFFGKEGRSSSLKVTRILSYNFAACIDILRDKMSVAGCLVVLAVSLTLGIKDTRPVVGFKVELVVDIYLNFDVLSRLLDGESGDTSRRESTSQQFSKARWAPVNNFSSLQVELGSKNGVVDGSTCDLSERKGLVDRRALVTKGVNGTLLVDGNADSQTTGFSRSGLTRLGKVSSRNAGHIFKRRLKLGHAQSRVELRTRKIASVMLPLRRGIHLQNFTYSRLAKLAGEGGNGTDKGKKDRKLHLYKLYC